MRTLVFGCLAKMTPSLGILVQNTFFRKLIQVQNPLDLLADVPNTVLLKEC